MNTSWLFLGGKDRGEGQKKLTASACSATLTDIHLSIYSSQVLFLKPQSDMSPLATPTLQFCMNGNKKQWWGAITADWPQQRTSFIVFWPAAHRQERSHSAPQSTKLSLHATAPTCKMQIWSHQALKAKHQANPEPGKLNCEQTAEPEQQNLSGQQPRISCLSAPCKVPTQHWPRQQEPRNEQGLHPAMHMRLGSSRDWERKEFHGNFHYLNINRHPWTSKKWRKKKDPSVHANIFFFS